MSLLQSAARLKPPEPDTIDRVNEPLTLSGEREDGQWCEGGFRMDVVAKQIAQAGEPVPYGDVPLAPFGLSHRTEAELAAALAEPAEHDAPSIAPTGGEPRSVLASLAAFVRR